MLINCTGTHHQPVRSYITRTWPQTESPPDNNVYYLTAKCGGQTMLGSKYKAGLDCLSVWFQIWERHFWSLIPNMVEFECDEYMVNNWIFKYPPLNQCHIHNARWLGFKHEQLYYDYHLVGCHDNHINETKNVHLISHILECFSTYYMMVFQRRSVDRVVSRALNDYTYLINIFQPCRVGLSVAGQRRTEVMASA